MEGYYIRRRTSSSGSYQVLNSSGWTSANSYKDTDVVSGQTYFYVVTAVDETNLQNESDNSNEASAAPLALSAFGSSAGSGCFVATSAFGTPMAEEVQVLSRFRDECLLNTTFGRRLVSIYYKIGPMVAREVEKKQALKSIVRAALKPLISLCKVRE